jgi:hypothetical protein
MEMQAIDTLRDLIQGEISAIETYVQAIKRFGKKLGGLVEIKDEHIEAANSLRQYVHERGAVPETGSGLWGGWVKAVEGTAKIFGKNAALVALKEGEELGISLYEDAMRDEALEFSAKELIDHILLPRTRNHIKMLEHMMHA